MRWGKIVYGIGAVTAVGAAGGLAYHHDLVGVYRGYQYSQEEVQVLEDRLEQVEARNTELRREDKELQEDSLELEAAIRESKGHVREDETVYRIEWPPAGDAGKETEPN
jgi:hypothetical protein